MDKALNNKEVSSSSDLKYKILFESFDRGIIIFDSDGKIFDVNPAFINLIGYQKSDLLNKKINDFFDDKDFYKKLLKDKDLISGNKAAETFEKRLETKSGDKLWVQISTSFAQGEDEEITGAAFIEDITKEKLIESKLDEERNVLDTLMKHFPDSIFFKDVSSRYLKVNEYTLKKFGLKSEDDIIGKSDFDFYAKEYASRAKSREETIIKSGNPLIGIEEKETWPDGSITWVSTTRLPMKSSSGDIIGTVGISRDVTKQKEIELRLKEDEERYKTFSDVTLEGIIIHDEGVVVDANTAFCEMIGYDLEEIIGTKLIEKVVDPKDWEKIYKNISRKVTTPYEITVLKKDGTRLIVEIEASNSFAKGRPVRIATIRDITERTRNEKIREALYSISESVNNIANMDDLYVKLHQITKSLMAAENFYIALYDKENNMISFPYFYDQYDDPPETREFGRGLTEYILRTERNMLITAEDDIKLREEGETDLMGEPSKIWMGIILRIQEEVIGAIVLQDYHDEKTYGQKEKEILEFVSEQIALAIDKKRSEEQLKIYSNELKELIASKDKFFSIIAHDLKSPFNALIGYSEMIAQEHKEMAADELGVFAENMYFVAKKTYNLLENLLEWSRVQTGRMSFNPEPIALFQVAQQVVDIFVVNAKKKGIVLRNRISPEFEVIADSNMIFTVMRNLTSNAIKFTSEGDEVTITAVDEGMFIKCSVKDTGLGISEEDQQKLFRIDIHHSEIGTDQEKGTGLGLLLCKELIEKNGGTIWVESAPGKGSEFFFSIPKS